MLWSVLRLWFLWVLTYVGPSDLLNRISGFQLLLDGSRVELRHSAGTAFSETGLKRDFFRKKSSKIRQFEFAGILVIPGIRTFCNEQPFVQKMQKFTLLPDR